MNCIQIMGRLGRDPEQKTTQSGKVVAKTSVAVRETADKTTWFNVVAWDKTAEALSRLKKGDLAGFEGRMTCDEVEKDGKKVYYWSLVAHRVHYTGKSENGRQEAAASADDAPF